MTHELIVRALTALIILAEDEIKFKLTRICAGEQVIDLASFVRHVLDVEAAIAELRKIDPLGIETFTLDELERIEKTCAYVRAMARGESTIVLSEKTLANLRELFTAANLRELLVELDDAAAAG